MNLMARIEDMIKNRELRSWDVSGMKNFAEYLEGRDMVECLEIKEDIELKCAPQEERELLAVLELYMEMISVECKEGNNTKMYLTKWEKSPLRSLEKVDGGYRMVLKSDSVFKANGKRVMIVKTQKEVKYHLVRLAHIEWDYLIRMAKYEAKRGTRSFINYVGERVVY